MESLRPSAASVVVQKPQTTKPSRVHHSPTYAAGRSADGGTGLASLASKSTKGVDRPAAAQQQSLPTFLSRRQPDVARSPRQPLQTAPPVEDDDNEDDTPLRALPPEGSERETDGAPDLSDDDDDEELGLPDHLLDLDEGDVDDSELRRLAEDMSAETGMSHAEVMELLEEHRKKKAAKRAEKHKAAAAPRGTRDASFLTATPDLCLRGVTPVVAPASVSRAVVHSTEPQARGYLQGCHHEGVNGNNVPAVVVHAQDEELPADRTRRLLQELYADTAHSSAAIGDDEGFTSLDEYRAKRAAEKHAAVLAHLERNRGDVPVPRALHVSDALVKAYELDAMKRKALKELKADHDRRLKEDAERERRMKGIFVNLAIRKQIEERSHAVAVETAIKSSRRSTQQVPAAKSGLSSQTAPPLQVTVVGSRVVRPVTQEEPISDV